MLRLILMLGLLIGPAAVTHGQSRAQDYRQQQAGRYRIVFCPEDAEVVTALFGSLAESVPVVHQQLGLNLADTVTFVVTPTKEEWARVTAGAPLWANGIAYPDRKTAVLKSPRFALQYGPLPQTAIHEYVHLLLEVGAPNADFPRWFDEGLAQLVAGQVSYLDVATLSRAVAARRVHRFSHLQGLMGMNDQEARQGYAESLVAVQLMLQRFGWAGIGNLIHTVRSGVPFDEAMPRVLLVRVSSFEQDYANTIATTYRSSWLADTELWVSGLFVVLIAVGGYAAWRRRRRTLEQWHAEEHPEPRDGEASPPPYVINYEIIRERKQDETDTAADDNPPPSKRDD